MIDACERPMPDSVTKTAKPRPLDDETAAALTLFNTYLVADREQQAHERALKKAERAKDEAAAAVRELNDRKVPASEVVPAEDAYREAAEALRRLRGGETAVAEGSEDEAAADAEEAAPADGDAPAEDAEEAAPAADTEQPSEAEQPASVGVEASVGDDDLAGDEPAGVTG